MDDWNVARFKEKIRVRSEIPKRRKKRTREDGWNKQAYTVYIHNTFYDICSF